VAGFLEAQDDVDRAQRYEDIRSAHRDDSEFDDSDDFQSTTEIDIDLDLFEDAFQDPDPHDPDSQRPAAERTGSRSFSKVGEPSGEQNGAASTSATRGSARADSQRRRPKSSGQRGKAASSPGSAKHKPVRKPSSRRFVRPSLNLSGNGDQLKVVGVALCLLVALGVLGASVYHFYSGPSVRVLKSID
jgi:hypothetical protein